MGYYSTLEGAHSFKTWCRSQADIRQAFEQEFAGRPELKQIEDLGYELVIRENDGVHYIDIEASEYTQKHWYENELVRLIRKLLAPGGRTYLIFVGEDGEHWGYAITPESIQDIEHVYRVNGRLLDDWLAEADTKP